MWGCCRPDTHIHTHMRPCSLQALIKINDTANLHLLDTDVSINNSRLQSGRTKTNGHLYSRFRMRSVSLAEAQLRDTDARADTTVQRSETN